MNIQGKKIFILKKNINKITNFQIRGVFMIYMIYITRMRNLVKMLPIISEKTSSEGSTNFRQKM